MTHWQLEDGQPVEIINYIDDYSRAVLASVAVPVATSSDVVRIFFDTAALYGLPAPCSATTVHLHHRLPGQPHRHGDRTGHLGSPSNTESPTIRRPGKVERYHLTLKKYLRKKPAAATLAELQGQIDRFVHIYNEERPHTVAVVHPCAPGALSTRPPSRSTDRNCWLIPRSVETESTRRRLHLRYRSKLHHVGVGREHRGKRILILMADLDIRVIDENGVTIRHLELDRPLATRDGCEISSEGSLVPEILTHHRQSRQDSNLRHRLRRAVRLLHYVFLCVPVPLSWAFSPLGPSMSGP